jgi:carbonic anhydrase
MSERPDNLSASEALEELTVGNRRFVEEAVERPRADRLHRIKLAKGQTPFATIITCADSRVPVELLFDQGLGDLFVIRVAGNIADDAILGSVEYASLNLGVNLVVVMGHQSCGAVGAAVDYLDAQGAATGTHIDALIDAIRPAVRAAKDGGDENLVERSVRTNATMVAQQIRSSEPVLSDLGQAGVVVRPAYYDLATGEVSWLS